MLYPTGQGEHGDRHIWDGEHHVAGPVLPHTHLQLTLPASLILSPVSAMGGSE